MIRHTILWRCEVSGKTFVYADTEDEAMDKFHDMPLEFLVSKGKPVLWADSDWEVEVEPRTVVLFRWWRDEVLALLPEDEWMDGHCTSYAHVGQHGPAHFRGIMEESRPATPEEYADLFTEMENMEYNLDVRETYTVGGVTW